MIKFIFYLITILLFIAKPLFSVVPVYETKAKTAFIANYETNTVLFQKDPYEKISPASITKLMTIYIIFDDLKKGLVSLDTYAIVSNNAYKKGNYRNGGSTMFLRKGQTVKVDDLIKGIIVVSGNDASIVMSELIVGTEEQFLNKMNEKAKELGMTNTHFQNVDGIYDKDHYSTAYDLYILSNHLIKDFPEYYHYFSIPEFTFNGITQKNRNPLLFLTFSDGIVPDGLKTGHVDQSGYSMSFSATKNDKFRITGIIIGTVSNEERKIESKKLLDWVYRNYERRVIYHKGDIIKEVPLYNAKDNTMAIIANEDIFVIVPKSIKDSEIKQTLTYKNYYMSPLKKGEKIATLDIILKDSDYNLSYDIYAEKNVDLSSGIFRYVLAPYYAIKKTLGN